LLNPDYRDMLYAFSEEGVRYLIIGAYGHVRATGDMDLWVERGEENARRVVAALGRFGAPMREVEARDSGHDVATVASETPGIPDELGLERAVGEGRVLITFDRDTGAYSTGRTRRFP
jgi:hypothetical protein